MFDAIRKHQRILQFVLLILILPAFVFFGISGYEGMLTRDRGVALVDGREITQQEFDAAQRQQIEQMRRMLGDAVDPKLFDTPESRAEIVEGLIAQRVIADEAAGRRIAVTDERVRQTILGIPGLRRDDGGFDDARYKAMLSGQNMTPAGFESRLRSDLAMQALPDSVQASVLLPKAVRDRLIALQEEGREVREQRFAAADFASKVQPTDEAIAAYHEANGRAFETPESARVELVVLSREALAARVEVSPEDLRGYYEQNRARFGTPEERRASHVLIKAGPDAKAKAEALAEKLRADPSQFAAVAKAESQDPGSAAQGGDLGFFARDAMVKPFADAAFTMKEGEVRGPVESEFGMHVIRLTAVKPGAERPFEAVRAELEQEVRQQQAGRRYAEAAEQFTNTVYEQSDSLKPAADKFGLKIETVEGVSRQPRPDAPRGAPLSNPRLLAALFGEDGLRNKRNTEAIEIAPGRLASARIAEYRPAERKPLAEVRDQVRARIVAEESARLAREAGEARLAELKAGKGDAAGFGAPKTVSRGTPSGLAPPLLEAIFRIPSDPVPAYGGAELPGEGYSVFQLVRTVAPTPEQIAARQAAYEQQLARVLATQEVAAYVESLKRRAKIVRHAERAGARGEGGR
ncbi:MAG TPA: SurA N-terminal domain-containing protein [Burkholderiaceae bacterium]|nr:SurA N-terminal domain-containing protein [Burkholderiaceae bacterium]